MGLLKLDRLSSRSSGEGDEKLSMCYLGAKHARAAVKGWMLLLLLLLLSISVDQK